MSAIRPRRSAESTHSATAPDPPPSRGGWLRLVGTSLLAAVLAVIVGIGVLAIVVPAVTGSTALTVLTSSMEPHLQPGTMVVVRPTDPADIEPGMVVTNQLKSGEAAVVTHRVTQSLLTADGERVFITQSDANPSADIDPVRGVQIRETVWYAIPCVGWAPWSFRVSSARSSSRSPWWHSSATPPGPSSRRSSTKHAPPHNPPTPMALVRLTHRCVRRARTEAVAPHVLLILWLHSVGSALPERAHSRDPRINSYVHW